MEKQLTKAEIASAKSLAKTLRVTRRSILFFIRTLLLIVLVVFLCIAAFLTTARLSNTYILVNEGMALRAASMLRGGDDPDLAVYFTGDCVRDDAALRTQSTTQFADFTVTDYEYDLTIDRLHVFPWQTDLYADVIEQITAIKGSASAESGVTEVPTWTPIRYRLHLEQLDARWYICSIELIELNPTLPDANTPDPNQSPLPMITPTPEPTPIAIHVS